MDITAHWGEVLAFLETGGMAIWAIALLSVLTLALILWKTWRMLRIGAWAGARTERAVVMWESGDAEGARARLANRSSIRAKVADAAMGARQDASLNDAGKREEIQRVAMRELSQARTGLRSLELISTIAPLLGLLGTVLGMIEAFQTLQASGARADPAALAGGIWEALLTTAAGMAVAIPAGVALTWFESVTDRVQGDIEDAATRILNRGPSYDALKTAAQ